MNIDREKGVENSTALELTVNCRSCPMYEMLLEQSNTYKQMINELKEKHYQQLIDVDRIMLN